MSLFKILVPRLLVVTSVLGLPSFAVAATAYASFTPAPAQVRAAATPSFVECFSQAGVNSTLRNNCVEDELSQVERRIDETYRVKLASRSADDAAMLRTDHLTWLRARDVGCDNKVESLRGIQGTLNGRFELVKQCRLQESLRRVVWLETQI
jgi:uncharacterized protein YecT (DUF1311 family)